MKNKTIERYLFLKNIERKLDESDFHVIGEYLETSKGLLYIVDLNPNENESRWNYALNKIERMGGTLTWVESKEKAYVGEPASYFAQVKQLVASYGFSNYTAFKNELDTLKRNRTVGRYLKQIEDKEYKETLSKVKQEDREELNDYIKEKLGDFENSFWYKNTNRKRKYIVEDFLLKKEFEEITKRFEK